MAYSLPVGTVAEITFVGDFANQTIMSVFHYVYVTPVTITDGAAALSTLVADFNTQLRPSYMNCLGSDYSLTALTGQSIFPLRYQRLTFPQAGAPGTANPAGTASTCAAITRKAERADRHAQGTLHVPCVPADGFANGRFTLGYLTLLSTLASALDNGLTSGGGGNWTPIIFNRQSPAASYTVRGATAQETVRTMRRRVVGRGI